MCMFLILLSNSPDTHVHLEDYYYYATAGGAKLWVCAVLFKPWTVVHVKCNTQWKQYLTTMQIAQFVVILVAGFFAGECQSTFILPPF